MYWHFCTDDRKVRGPVSSPTLAKLYQVGHLEPDHQVFAEGDSRWSKAREHPVLRDHSSNPESGEETPFYFHRTGQSIGPFSQNEINELAHGKVLDRTDQVTKDGGANWLNVGAAFAAGLIARNWMFTQDDITGYYDLDGDGFAETFAVDSDGDGLIDGAVFDTNQDGLVDVITVDSNLDGEFDATLVDSNFDGRVDFVGIDSNYDGEVDTMVADLDYDGSADFAALPEAPDISGVEDFGGIADAAEEGGGIFDFLSDLLG